MAGFIAPKEDIEEHNGFVAPKEDIAVHEQTVQKKSPNEPQSLGSGQSSEGSGIPVKPLETSGIEIVGSQQKTGGQTQDKYLMDFERRALNPTQSIKNSDGTSSTHRMESAGVDGKQIAYPTIVNINGKLVELSSDDAIAHALKTGEYREFPTEKEAQLYAEGGYKKGTPLENPEEWDKNQKAQLNSQGVLEAPVTEVIPTEIETSTETGTNFSKEQTDLGKLVKQGQLSAKQANILTVTSGKLTPKQITELAKIQREKESLGTTEGQKKWEQAETFDDHLQAIADDPMGVLGGIVLPSVIAQYNHGLSRMATGAAMGAAIAAPTGVGIPAGAATGALAGSISAGANLEYANNIIDSFAESGVDVKDAEQLKNAFADEKILGKAREFALKRGVPIAVFDLVSGGIASKINAVGGKGVLKEMGKAALAATAEGVTGAAGEAAAQVVSGQDLNLKEIAAEGLGGVAGSAPNVVTAITPETQQNQRQQKRNELHDANKPYTEPSGNDVAATEAVLPTVSSEPQNIPTDVQLASEATTPSDVPLAELGAKGQQPPSGVIDSSNQEVQNQEAATLPTDNGVIEQPITDSERTVEVINQEEVPTTQSTEVQLPSSSAPNPDLTTQTQTPNEESATQGTQETETTTTEPNTPVLTPAEDNGKVASDNTTSDGIIPPTDSKTTERADDGEYKLYGHIKRILEQDFADPEVKKQIEARNNDNFYKVLKDAKAIENGMAYIKNETVEGAIANLKSNTLDNYDQQVPAYVILNGQLKDELLIARKSNDMEAVSKIEKNLYDMSISMAEKGTLTGQANSTHRLLENTIDPITAEIQINKMLESENADKIITFNKAKANLAEIEQRIKNEVSEEMENKYSKKLEEYEKRIASLEKLSAAEKSITAKRKQLIADLKKEGIFDKGAAFSSIVPLPPIKPEAITKIVQIAGTYLEGGFISAKTLYNKLAKELAEDDVEKAHIIREFEKNGVFEQAIESNPKLKEEYDKIVKEKKLKEFAKVLSSKIPLAKKIKQNEIYTLLDKAEPLGEESMDLAVQKLLGFHEITEEQKAKAKDLAYDIQWARAHGNDAVIINNRTTKYLNYMQQIMPKSLLDYYWAYRYPSILSGINTQEGNIISQLANTIGDYATEFVKNPQLTIQSAKEGLSQGSLLAKLVMQGEYNQSIAMQPKDRITAEGFKNPLSVMKYVSRFMGASEVVFSWMPTVALYENKLMAGKNIDPLGGFTIPDVQAIKQEVFEAITKKQSDNPDADISQYDNTTKTLYQAAVNNSKRQVDPEITNIAVEQANKANYKNHPIGLMGTFLDQLGQMQNKSLFKFTKLFFDFARTSANMINHSLNYVPAYGLLRAYNVSPSALLNKLNRKDLVDSRYVKNELDKQKILEAQAKMTAITFAISTAAFMSDDDDPEKRFVDISGATPVEGGLKPNQIKIGNVKIPYAVIPPLAITFGAIGNTMDLRRKKELSDHEIDDYSAFATLVALNTAKTIIDGTPIRGLNKMMTDFEDMLKAGQESTGKGAEKALQNAVAIASNATIGTANPRLIKDALTYIDPNQYKPEDWRQAVVATSGLAPILNKAGEMTNYRIDAFGRKYKLYAGERYIPLRSWFEQKGDLDKFLGIVGETFETAKDQKYMTSTGKRYLTPSELQKLQEESGQKTTDWLTKPWDAKTAEQFNASNLMDYYLQYLYNDTKPLSHAKKKEIIINSIKDKMSEYRRDVVSIY